MRVVIAIRQRMKGKSTSLSCHPEWSVASKRFFRLATGAPEKPAFGFLGWE
jgi:hypothetical protein